MARTLEEETQIESLKSQLRVAKKALDSSHYKTPGHAKQARNVAELQRDLNQLLASTDDGR